MAIRVIINETVTEVIRTAEREIRDNVHVVAGEGVADRCREHFADLQQTRPNKQGWPRTNFWAAVYKSVQNPSRRVGNVTVDINHIGIAQRYFGGTIRPKPGKKLLTIPAQASAYGKRAREFPFLRFAMVQNPFGKLQPALVEAQRTEVRIGRKNRQGTRSITPVQSVVGGGVFFWLTPKVTQQPDPSVMPTETELNEAASSRAAAYIERKLEEGGK